MINEINSLGRVRGLELETADTWASSGGSSNSEESVFTPIRTPRVLENPEIFLSFSSVSDYEDSVVELGSAGCGTDNSASIGLEDISVGFNSDGDWLLGTSS